MFKMKSEVDIAREAVLEMLSGMDEYDALRFWKMFSDQIFTGIVNRGME